MKTNNRTVLDLAKVQHGTFWYVNQYGTCRIKPHTMPTVRGKAIFDPREMAAYHPDYPGETLLERAVRLDILDVWAPVVQFQLAANHNVVYTGEKATAMWKAWNERIFNKKGKK